MNTWSVTGNDSAERNVHFSLPPNWSDISHKENPSVRFEIIQNDFAADTEWDECLAHSERINEQVVLYAFKHFSRGGLTTNLAPQLFRQRTDLEWHHNLCTLPGVSVRCQSAWQQRHSAICGGSANGRLIRLHSPSLLCQWRMVCPY